MPALNQAYALATRPKLVALFLNHNTCQTERRGEGKEDGKGRARQRERGSGGNRCEMVEKRLNSPFSNSETRRSLYFATLENTPGRIRDRDSFAQVAWNYRAAFQTVPQSAPDPADPIADCLTTSFLSYPMRFLINERFNV